MTKEEVIENIKKAEEKIGKENKKIDRLLEKTIKENYLITLEKPIRTDARWADPYNADTIYEYEEKIRKRHCSDGTAYCSRIIDFGNDREVWEEFIKRLRNRYGFLEGTGGRKGLDTIRYGKKDLKKEKELVERSEKELKETHKTLIMTARHDCTLVRISGKDDYVIDPEGKPYIKKFGIIGYVCGEQ